MSLWIKAEDADGELWLLRTDEAGNILSDHHDTDYVWKVSGEESIGADSNANVYIHSYYNNEIEKYNKDAIRQWNISCIGLNEPLYDIKTDYDSNVIAVGTNFQKIDTEGGEIFNYNIPNEFGYNYANRIAFDGNNNIYLFSGYYGTVMKHDASTGLEMWESRTSDPDGHVAMEVAADSNNNFYCPVQENTWDDQYHLVKYDADGNLVWKKYDIVPQRSDYDYLYITTNTSDQVILLGGETPQDLTAVNPDGSIAWLFTEYRGFNWLQPYRICADVGGTVWFIHEDGLFAKIDNTGNKVKSFVLGTDISDESEPGYNNGEWIPKSVKSDYDRTEFTPIGPDFLFSYVNRVPAENIAEVNRVLIDKTSKVNKI